MSGLLFLLDVIAFVVVVFWIYAIDGRGGSAARGLLGVKDAGPKAPKPPKPPKRPGAGWRGAARSAGAGRLPATRGVPAASSSTPGWKRMPARSPPRPRA